ncbi:exonuclease domain-containing protein [Thalassotalea psychrophila]|uniref:DNA-directed DNA polymerase n=1 Tax=Thalassotalea psychrophila TaxID=3065647 RepID=A0ABY9TQF2_9GAMM|nr:exonuclease domain-containing protein [Colwelliaceae bacterium SQ149]
MSKSKRTVIINVETTGLSTKTGCRVIEIACVEVVKGTLTQHRFNSLIHPCGRKITNEAYKRHGLQDTDLAEAPKFQDIAQQLINFCEGAKVVTYNADFDIDLLAYECKKQL